MVPADLFQTSGALTLLQLTTAVGNAVRAVPSLQGAWVIAELSDVRVNGGHCYMELIEKNESGQTVAKLRATIWASRLPALRRKFLQATGRDIATGMKVMLFGAISHHPLYGLSFTINDIDPSYTLGDLERLRREILNRLQREGIINRNKETALDIAPQRIAVVSAAGAAGFGDFMNQLENNPYGFVFYPFLFSATMQGERTSQSVRESLELIEQTIDLWDCVAIIRGGGATTDLNGFDDYELARAVALFPLPVIVGIGHERDRTVLDEIAHTRMKTPTAAAAFFTDRLRGACDLAGRLMDAVVKSASDRLTGEERRLTNCRAMIPVLASSRISSAKAVLDKTMMQLPAIAAARIASADMHLETLKRMLKINAGNLQAKKNLQLKGISDKITVAAQNILNAGKQKTDALQGITNALDPRNTLRRGYSVTRLNGKAITDAGSLSGNDLIETTFLAGKIRSKVTVEGNSTA